jgi:hypothetical protein
METLSLYGQVLGPAFANLAPALRRLHGPEQRSFSGMLAVRTGANPLARLSLWLARLPNARIDALCHLCLLPSQHGEHWQRLIGPWKFITHQRMAGNCARRKKEIRERFGAITLRLRLRIKGESLCIRSVSTKILGAPLPRSWGIRVVAIEKPVDRDSFYCNVRVYLPGAGGLLRYRGTLRQGDPRLGNLSSALQKSSTSHALTQS